MRGAGYAGRVSGARGGAGPRARLGTAAEGRGADGGRSGVAPLQLVQALRRTATHYENVDGLRRSPWGVAY